MPRAIPHAVIAALEARQTDTTDVPSGYVLEDDGRIVPFWYSRTGEIIKWSVFLGLALLVSLYLIGGYVHAKRRIRKGLPPLGYHRWLIGRAELARVDPRYAYPQAAGYSTYRPDYYGMQTMPPPVYDQNRPPVYEPPEGGSKVNPAQSNRDHQRTQPSNDFEPPIGPPPSAVTANHTGASTTSNNPYRQ